MPKLRHFRRWIWQIARRAECRIGVLACAVWLFWLQAYQPWRYSTLAYRRASVFEQVSFFFWRIGFNISRSDLVAVIVGILSIVLLVYLSGWVVRSFRRAPTAGNNESHGRGPHDGSTAGGGFNQADPQRADRLTSKERRADDTGANSATHRHWNDLPEAVRQRLLARQAEATSGDHWRFKVRGQAASWAFLAVFCVWIVCLSIWGLNSPEQLKASYSWIVPLTLCGAIMATWGGGRLLRWRQSHLKPFFYATRLYFIYTEFDDLCFWQITDLLRLQVIPADSAGLRGGYLVDPTTGLLVKEYMLEFRFVDRVQRVSLAESAASKFQNDFKRWQRENNVAVAGNDLSYIISHDDFLGLRGAGPFQSTLKRAAVGLPEFVAAALVAGFVLVPVLITESDYGKQLMGEWSLVVPDSAGADTKAATLSNGAAEARKAGTSADIFDQAAGQKKDRATVLEGIPPPPPGFIPDAPPIRASTQGVPPDVGSGRGQPLGDPCQASAYAAGNRPENGAVIHEEQASQGYGKLIVTNGNSDDAALIVSDAAAVLDDRLIYVRAGMTTTMNGIPPGQYRLTFQIGKGWDAATENFRCVNATAVFDQMTSFAERNVSDRLEYSEVSVTLHKLVGGNAHTTRVSPAVFRRRRTALAPQTVRRIGWSSNTDDNVNNGSGGVSPPTVIFKVEPEYSEEARKANYTGTVLLSVIVDKEGRARDIHVLKSLGMGLDGKAMEAVQKWKFKPGMKGSQAVDVPATIKVDFRVQ